MSTRRARHLRIVGWVFASALSAAWAPTQIATGESLSAVAVLDEWGNRITSLGVTVRENALRTQVRTTIAQLAMFDAVNAALDGNFEPFASKPAAAPGASPEAAAIGAAYTVALYEFPSQLETIDTAYANSIARLSASEEEIEAGIAVGEAAANAVLAKRERDNRNLPDLTGYTPANGPWVWIPTPPAFAAPQTPFLQFVTPFGYGDPARFRPIAPPPLESREYLADYLEVKDFGAFNSPSRTAEQSATALFWSGSASALWTANVRSLASPMDILTGARFEALGIAAITNALIATWDSKFHYMFWRPITAIRAGDTDGNPYTEADPEWIPFIVIPFHPEYIAAHSAVGAATTGFYTVWFGADRFPLDFKGTGGAVRHYESVEEIPPRKATRACGVACTGATAPKSVRGSARESVTTRRRTSSSRFDDRFRQRRQSSGVQRLRNASWCRGGIPGYGVHPGGLRERHLAGNWAIRLSRQPISNWSLSRGFTLGAIRCKARQHRWHLRQPWHRGLCNLENLKEAPEFESHSLRQFRINNLERSDRN